MTLREKQSTFAINVARLIIWAAERGYEVTFAEAYRPPEWFVERVERLERKLDKVGDQQEDHLRNYHGLTR